MVESVEEEVVVVVPPEEEVVVVVPPEVVVVDPPEVVSLVSSVVSSSSPSSVTTLTTFFGAAFGPSMRNSSLPWAHFLSCFSLTGMTILTSVARKGVEKIIFLSISTSSLGSCPVLMI